MYFNKKIYTTFLACFVFLIFFIAVFCFVFNPRKIELPGTSMTPLFEPNDWYLTSRWWIKINRFNIVIVHEPDRDDRLLIKRVIGISGETLELKQGKVFVNGKLLIEPHIKNIKQGGVENYIMRDGSFRVTIPEKSYFFMGDNRDNSYDSRNFGPLHEKHVQGKIVAIIWPPSRVKWLW